MTVQADAPADELVGLPADVATLLAERTQGWDADRKHALARELRRQAARATPGALARVIDPTTVQTAALDLIDRELVEVDAGRRRRLIITVPPQEGKSTRVARYGALWALLRDPERRVAVASYAVELAAGHGRFVRDLIETHGSDAVTAGGDDLLGLRVSRKSRAASRWDLAGHRGGMYAVGLEGGLTGKPVDWMIIDDPHKDRADADSLARRNFVWDWWTNVVIPRLAPNAPVVLIMTRWHEDDLAGRLLETDRALPEDQQEWRIINIPAQAIDEHDVLKRKPGEWLASARRRTYEQWESIKRSVGARVWSALYQGAPTPAAGGVFQWDWIRPHRVRDAPDLPRVVVAVDTTGGGHDEAGIVAAGRGPDRRTYVLADRSGRYTAGGQWRQAWFTVLDLEADVLVYENNLVDPVMRKAIPAAWRRMREQARALQAAGLLEVDPDDVDEAIWIERLTTAVRSLGARGDDDVESADDPQTALTSQLVELLPYAQRILDTPDNGPARVEGVRATRGKTTRAEPCSQAYETGQVSHVGVFPALEQEMVTWQEGQDSPNRLDALVWAWTHLAVGSTPGKVAAPRTGRIATETAALSRTRNRR